MALIDKNSTLQIGNGEDIKSSKKPDIVKIGRNGLFHPEKHSQMDVTGPKKIQSLKF